MAKLHLANNVVVEFDAAEAGEIFLQLGKLLTANTDGHNGQTQLQALTGAGQDSTKTVWNKEKVRSLWNWVYGDQKKLLEYLLAHGGEASKKDIMKHLGFASGNVLAGVLSSITRNAQKAANDKSVFVVQWRMTRDGHEGYFIVSEVLPMLLEVSQEH